MTRSKKRPISAEDLYRLTLIQECQISPDGKHVAYSVQRIDRESKKVYSNLWIASTRGGRARQFTYGDQIDRQPQWSPDGDRIAFLSNRTDEKQPQLYVIPLGGGEARPLTEWDGNFGSFEWSPDGRRLAAQFRKKDEEELARAKDEERKKLGIVRHHIDRLFFKRDGTGYLPKERWHVWTVESRTGRSRQLTFGDIHDETGPTWSPDGALIAFCSNRTPDPDLNPEVIDLFVMPADGGEPRRIDTPVGPKELARFSPDGRRLAYVGHEGLSQWWKNDGVWVVPVDNSEPAKNLTGSLDVHVGAETINDMGTRSTLPPVWSKDGNTLFFQVSREGNTGLVSIDMSGRDLQVVIGNPGVVGAFGFDSEQRLLAYWFGTMTDPGRIWVRQMATSRTAKVARQNENLLRARDLGEVEEVWFKGAAGNDLQGWIIKPPGFDPERTYPSILEIHGGPLVQYGNLFMHEFFYLAAGGYVVYFANPRGGRGYGEEHAKAIWNAWGTVDYEDLMAWVDHVAQFPYIDPERMGVTGGSYGGYMTNWIIGHTDRFKAAVTQRSVSNLISMWGSSDFNWVFQQVFGGLPPWENPEGMWRRSPMYAIGKAKTPTLVIHSLQDLRCAVEQGEQVYVALKKLGVDTELVLFPDEPHGLSREGRTDRRIARLEQISSWFDKYLAPSR